MIAVYCIRNLINDKKYVGVSTNVKKRIIAHRSIIRSGVHNKNYNRHLINDAIKFGPDAFTFEILEELDTSEKSVLHDRESFWMTKLNTRDREFGYNLRMDTADNKCHAHHETSAKISDSVSGIKNPNYGNTWDAEQRNNASLTAKKLHSDGHTYGDAWRSKISAKSSQTWSDLDKRKNMAVKVSQVKLTYQFARYSKTGELVDLYQTLKQVIECNPDYKWQIIYAACNGGKKSYRGYIWKRYPIDMPANEIPKDIVFD